MKMFFKLQINRFKDNYNKIELKISVAKVTHISEKNLTIILHFPINQIYMINSSKYT